MDSRRVQQIDAARGTAMLFVFLSHFGLVYFHRNGAIVLDNWFEWIGMVATPTFMIISGVMLGFLFETHQRTFGTIRTKMRDRGFFFLVVGHFVISIAHIPRSDTAWSAFSFLFITDTIGLCLLIGPSLVEACRPRLRILLGSILYVVSWACGLLWNPGTIFAEVSKASLVGILYDDAVHHHLYTFPVIPWLAVYLVFTCLGQEMGRLTAGRNAEKIPRMLGTISLSMVASGVLLAATKHLIRFFGNVPWPASPLWLLLYPFQKLPPGFTYILFYGGVGLLLMYALYALSSKGPVRRFIGYASVIGRASFFTFVVQYYVYYVAIYCANLSYNIFWPLYLVCSVGIIFYLARAWDRNGLNSVLTLGWAGMLAVRGLPFRRSPRKG